jgi:hypothetical protein
MVWGHGVVRGSGRVELCFFRRSGERVFEVGVDFYGGWGVLLRVVRRGSGQKDGGVS